MVSSTKITFLCLLRKFDHSHHYKFIIQIKLKNNNEEDGFILVKLRIPKKFQ